MDYTFYDWTILVSLHMSALGFCYISSGSKMTKHYQNIKTMNISNTFSKNYIIGRIVFFSYILNYFPILPSSHLIDFHSVKNAMLRLMNFPSFFHFFAVLFLYIKGTLIQIWKFINIFAFTWKQYVEDFTLKHLLLFERCAREIYEKVCLQTFRNNRIR